MNFRMELNNFSLVSVSEESERDLPTSERENGWWVTYRSIRGALYVRDRVWLNMPESMSLCTLHSLHNIINIVVKSNKTKEQSRQKFSAKSQAKIVKTRGCGRWGAARYGAILAVEYVRAVLGPYDTCQIWSWSINRRWSYGDFLQTAQLAAVTLTFTLWLWNWSTGCSCPRDPSYQTRSS